MVCLLGCLIPEHISRVLRLFLNALLQEQSHIVSYSIGVTNVLSSDVDEELNLFNPIAI